MKRPRIICHMASSIDGKIDGTALRNVLPSGEYERLHKQFKGNAWICGRTTMQQHFADAAEFRASDDTPAGPQEPFIAKQAESFAIAVDTTGKLTWASNDLDGDHLICILSERAARDYLARLREKSISYIVAGKKSVDLVKAVELLAERFSIRTLLLEGGGHINGGFLQAGLVDEVSLLIAPAIDGRHEIAATFDGMRGERQEAIPLRLKSVEERNGGVLWLRYDVVRG